ncbi:hypothetical protein [Thalassotalea sp. PLHSN55]|uniref:hypothetical protein n=1 Tax=Thalassotalea sp. PLHSN55 TaxID=3435888 RepID=UPI003F835CF9
MSSIWSNHAAHLTELVNGNRETQAHLYLEQLMLFPVDVQDKIIEEISHLSHCNCDAVANIISKHTVFDLD